MADAAAKPAAAILPSPATPRRRTSGNHPMRRRIALIFLMAWLGFLLALAFTLPGAKAGIRREAPEAIGAEVPPAWIAEALRDLPSAIPPAR
jgi:hypothetical protein